MYIDTISTESGCNLSILRQFYAFCSLRLSSYSVLSSV
jgi:hypothetical protein